MIDSNGTTHAYTHDKLGALLADTVTEFGTGVATTVARLENAYNERRLPVRATSLDGAGAVVNEVAWIYNNFNQAVKERQAHGGAAGSGSPEVQYNYAGGTANTIRPTGLTYPDGTPVTISYTSAMADALSRPDQLKLGTTTVADWAYLGMGTMVRRAYPAAGGAFFTLGTATAGYPGMDRFGRLARTLWQTGATTLVDTEYGRNRSGAVVWRRDALAHSMSVTNQDNFYWYDGLHQVTRHDRGNLTPTGGPLFTGVDPITRAQQETFAFDQTGNWHAYTAQSPALGQWREHDQANEITSITGPTGVVQPAYDAAGNMTTFPAPNDWDTAMVATWDAWNRLVSTGVGATVTTYAYDALSRRIKTVAGGVTRDTYFNNQWRAIEERLGGMIAARFVWNPMDRWDLILRERPAASETLYVLKDYLDPVAVIDTTGAVVERFGYDAFGPVRFMEADYSARSTSAHDWNFLFHAEFMDTGTGLYNYGYRYYHPQLGRWLSRDPIGIRGGINLYGFAENDPESLIDLLGQEILIIGGRFTKVGSSMTLQSVQSNWGIKHLANRVRSAFQEIIGDCAKLKIIEAGTDSTTISSSGGIKSVVRKRYRLTFSDEKASCKCNDCWQVLKNAIRNVSPVVQVRYLIDKDNAFGEITGSNRNIYINSGVDVDLPEQNPKGEYRDKRVPFPIVLWHEGIGHSHQGLGHPDVPANHAGSWDGLYVDPTIHEENRARNCTRLMNERYGGFLGLFGRELGDRRPTYYL